MSRLATSTETARSARRIADMKQKGNNKGLSRGLNSNKSSPVQQLSRATRRGLHSQSPITIEDDEDEDEEDGGGHASVSHAVSKRGMTATSNGRPSTTPVNANKKRPERKRQERKASVRKEQYQVDDSESELTDAPDEEEEGDDEDDDADTESDGEMAKRLQAAGDGESLLGSAASDRDQGETDEEEERFIIEDTTRRQKAKALTRRRSERDSMGGMTFRSGESGQAEDGYDDEGQDFPDDHSGSMSPQTLQQLGLDGFEDELFEPQEAFHSSSEPSFTDFFGSGSEDETDDGMDIVLQPRHDDDELTTDDEDDSDLTDISDLDEGMLSAAPFLAREALAAGASTQVAAGAEAGPADIPLLVIEDLDGRLIYARAGDGEAVFGSDGEFEFVDDSDEEDTDEDMDGLGFDYGDNSTWTSRRGNGNGDLGVDSDEGDTTDELPNEDMPFPRLLVGSVAPNGGRNARRARAMAVKSRRLSPNGQAQSREMKRSETNNEGVAVQSTPTTPGEGVQELDFSISTEALARDPKGTLEAAAKSLGLTPEEVARLVAGIQNESTTANDGGTGGDNEEVQEGDSSSMESPSNNFATLPTTPPVGEGAAASKPQMGSFMPTSFKSVHRAVIDGNRQAPSPFANRYGMQKRGLANRKRQLSTTTPSKRIRRFSSTDVASQHDGTGEETSEGGGTKSSSREASPIDPMELDDVVDASMLWRGSHSSSPPAGDEDQTTPMMRATKRASTSSNSTPATTSANSAAGLNLNAFARWHRIPMGAFRDGQGQSASSAMSQQPLGSFLLTRSRQQNINQSQTRRKQKASLLDQSPFRGRGEGDSIHLGTAPLQQNAGSTSNGRHSDAFIVSPILWPVRHGASEGHNNAAIWYTPKANESIENKEGDLTPRKVMTTKREKRQRRARKAAIKAAIRAASASNTGDVETSSWTGSPAPSNRSSTLLDSPASALPRLSITDASPRASPIPIGKSLPPSSLKFSHQAEDGEEEREDQQQSSFTITTNSNSHNVLSTSQSSQSSSNHSYQQPPSSVFGIPLHSPLFSGIFNPTNLGFRDDLEERDEEGVLTI